MRAWIYPVCFCLCTYGLYSQSSSSKAEQAQAAYQQLVSLDQQIENLVKQKLQLKEQLAEHAERADTGLLPGVSRRQSREEGELMQQMQGLSTQIDQLDSKRAEILLALQ